MDALMRWVRRAGRWGGLYRWCYDEWTRTQPR